MQAVVDRQLGKRFRVPFSFFAANCAPWFVLFALDGPLLPDEAVSRGFKFHWILGSLMIWLIQMPIIIEVGVALAEFRLLSRTKIGEFAIVMCINCGFIPVFALWFYTFPYSLGSPWDAKFTVLGVSSVLWLVLVQRTQFSRLMHALCPTFVRRLRDLRDGDDSIRDIAA